MNNPRCLYENSFFGFLSESAVSVLGMLCDRYHGDARTTTREAWRAEITIMQETLRPFEQEDGNIVFE